MESSRAAQASSAEGQSAAPASEGSRTRETLKYASSLIRNTVPINPQRPVDPSQVVPCPDAGLTAFAQLAALRLNVSRCLISFFDLNYQYVIAEATQSLALSPDVRPESHQLGLSGIAVPRGIRCPNEHVLKSSPTIHHDNTTDQASTPLPPVFVVPDLSQDECFAEAFCRQVWPKACFYAGVPIRSNKGINIGVYHVFDESPRDELQFSDADKQFMRDMASITWQHVESRAAIESIHRGERMVRGLGSFVEGQATLSSSAEQFQDAPGQEEGSLNQRQQGLQRDRDSIEDPTPEQERHHFLGSRSPDRRSAILDTSPPTAAPQRDSPPRSTVEAAAHDIDVNAFPNRPVSVMMPDPHIAQLRRTFSRAANILRESVEVEGALFLDASVGSFGGLVEDRKSRDSTSSNEGRSTAESSNEDLPMGRSAPSTGEPTSYCEVFGYSTTGASSIDGAASFSKHTLVPERLLKYLLRRYPAGKIFNFGPDGLPLSGGSETDDAKHFSPPRQKSSAPSDVKGKRRSKRPFSSLEGQAQAITALFPGARSVAVFPLWDQIKERWFAGGFIWTASRHRLFSTEGELSYLRAYATTLMGEIHRLNALNSDKVKGDFLSSLSHELRSPLHGVIAAVDLLNGTTLDAFQGDAIHIVETSGRTLLDTLDHLLDHSKVNTFMASSRLARKERRESPSESGGGRNLTGLGMMSLTTEVQVDILVEEVVEAVFAGFNFQRMSVAQLKEKDKDINDDNKALGRLDSNAAAEAFGHNPYFPEPNRPGLVVYLDMDPTVSWEFRAQAGALRRVVMNIFGNSLKFTQKGFVWISLRQVELQARDGVSRSKVVIIISDSGRGITEDFLRNDLFKPFTQEDRLAPGTGLGMSLVHSISRSLGGSLAITSQLGRGTTARVELPLRRPPTSTGRVSNLSEQFEQLQGLRICLKGFDRCYDRIIDKTSDLSSQVSESAVMEMLCRDWLGMQVIPVAAVHEEPPDVFLCSEGAFNDPDEHTQQFSLPTVVICQSALTAYSLTHSPRKSELNEFISQPVGPRRLARSLLLSLSSKTERPSEVASEAQENTSGPGSFSSNKEATGGSVGEDPMQAPELAKRPSSASSASAIRAMPSTPSDAGSGGTDVQGVSASPSEGGSRAAQVPLRQRQNATTEDTGLLEQPSSKYLLVDDNDINLKILASFMKKLGHDYDMASNGLEALQMYTADPGLYRFVLMDISMPLMDGLESTRKIRQLERADSIEPATIIALTGLGSATIQREAIASGMDLFLTKPVNLKSLKHTLGGYAEKKASRSTPNN
ncbi:hypothetical protein KVR01_010136 [Diaporthe batatas]|uniref:uncharacterized protein n=1 Tax=Diaporthe batatas TaxID=748121 RepID=UPI001D043037|nr:uncharacterized protein KVR01_010136 [Diaporthe batatas]KAG8159499.1 hypothetical protein KVR01_010136 [Diaporthe batatas]